MESGGIAAPGAAESMTAGIERFAGDSPLNGNVFGRIFDLSSSVKRRPHVAIKRNVFVHTPAGGTMVNNDVMIGIASDVVITLSAHRHTATYTDVAYDDIMGIDVEGTGNSYPLIGTLWSCYGIIGMFDVNFTVYLDVAGIA